MLSNDCNTFRARFVHNKLRQKSLSFAASCVVVLLPVPS